MEFKDVKEWLDANIELRKKLPEYEDFNEQIQLCGFGRKNTLHVFKGIDIIADVVGAELQQKEDWEDEERPYYYYFMYEGFEVFQMSRERLVRNVSV